MPVSTRRSLTPVDGNAVPPTTPGTKMRHLEAELESKETENESLRENVAELTSVLGKLKLVNPSVSSVATSTTTKVFKKRGKEAKPIVPAKTAYKFWLETQSKKEGVDMQQLWKEVDPKLRETFAALAKADKARFQKETEAYEQEQKALEMYRAKRKQEEAMAFYEAHLEAQAVLAKAQKEEGKKKKSIKDSDVPKRPTSSYMYFTQDVRACVSAKNPDAKVTEIAKILGQMWKSLGKDDAKKYEYMAAADRERYNKEKAVYDAKVEERMQEAAREEEARLEQEKKEALELMEAQNVLLQQINVAGNDNVSVMSDLSGSKISKKKKKKDPNAPKKALSAYNYFFSENRESIKKNMPTTATNAEVFAEVGKQWKALSDKKKGKYNKMSEKDQQRYSKEMEKYNTTSSD